MVEKQIISANLGASPNYVTVTIARYSLNQVEKCGGRSREKERERERERERDRERVEGAT